MDSAIPSRYVRVFNPDPTQVLGSEFMDDESDNDSNNDSNNRSDIEE